MVSTGPIFSIKMFVFMLVCVKVFLMVFWVISVVLLPLSENHKGAFVKLFET